VDAVGGRVGDAYEGDKNMTAILATLTALIGSKLGITIMGAGGTTLLSALGLWVLGSESLLSRAMKFGKSFGVSVSGKLPEWVENAIYTVACFFLSVADGMMSNNSQASRKQAEKAFKAVGDSSVDRSDYFFSKMQEQNALFDNAMNKMEGK